jgi:hypothetical protein
MMPIVDVSDTSMAASGTTKRISINNILACSPSATLASATITGAATVGTTLGVTGVSTFAAGTALLPGITTTGDTNTGIFNPAADIWAVSTGGTERFRVDSVGLGVGGSPTGTFPVILVEGGAGTYAKFNSKVGAKTWSAGYRSGTLQYEIQEDGVERFVIANGGNVGVGVTPSATDSTYYQALEIGRVGQGLTGAKSALTSSPNSWFSNNSYATYSAGIVWNYAVSQPAAQYRLVDASHQWYRSTDVTPTAGNAITWTQAMTLDASGNLILQSSATPATLTVNGQLTVNATSNTNLRFSYRGSDGTTRVANITLA